MPQHIDFRCAVKASAPGLHLDISIDQHTIWQGDPVGHHLVHHAISDTEGQHVLILELSGKTQEHTLLDQDGKILRDLVCEVSDLTFNDMDIQKLFWKFSSYSHDRNATSAAITEPCYGVMGCNGRVEMPFSTPVYLWLLENL